VVARERQRVSLESQGPSRLSGTHRGVMTADGTGARPSSPVNATAAWDSEGYKESASRSVVPGEPSREASGTVCSAAGEVFPATHPVHCILYVLLTHDVLFARSDIHLFEQIAIMVPSTGNQPVRPTSPAPPTPANPRPL
jgi:hypothetical protein